MRIQHRNAVKHDHTEVQRKMPVQELYCNHRAWYQVPGACYQVQRYWCEVHCIGTRYHVPSAEHPNPEKMTQGLAKLVSDIIKQPYTGYRRVALTAFDCCRSV